MVTFLLTVAVLSALIVAGYRLNMYLYAQGAVGGNTRAIGSMQSVVVESFPMQPVREAILRERDYGLRYARVGLLMIAVLLIALAVSLVVALFAVL